MALLDGKQLRNQSTELGKLSGSGIVSFTAATMSFTSGSVLTTATANIVNPTDVVNKEYVDSVAAGLDPKESVAYTTTGDITLSGTGTQGNGDWSQALSAGDRILVKNQTDKTENGIYTADAAGWSRAEDHDGTPANEVTLGNFTFVEYGTLAGSGFVLHSTDSTNTPIITPGTDEQEWTLYSQAGAYTAGTGLNLNDGEFEIDVTGVGAGSYGSADSTTTFTVNSEGQLTAAADTQISIVASQVTDFDAAAETAIFEDPNFVDGTTIEFDVTAGDSVTAEVSDSSLTSAKLDTGSNGGATAGYVLSVDNNGDFKWKLDEGDISSIDAGNGLIGGGTAGDIQLNLGGTVSSDITFNFTNSANLSLGSFGGNEIESFSTHAHEILIMGHKANGIPTGNLTITEGSTVLSGDLIDGNVVVMGNTASLTGSTDVSIIAATGKLDMNSPEINVGTGFSTDVKIKGDYTTVEGETLDVTTNLVSIDSGTGPSQFLSGTDTTISASSSLNLTADEGNVTTGDGKGLQYTADYSTGFVANSLVTKAYVDSLDAAQITGVEAGNGLTGGGDAGSVVLDLGGTVSSDIEFNFTQSSNLTFLDAGVVKFNRQQAFLSDSAQYGRLRVDSQNRTNQDYMGQGYNWLAASTGGINITSDQLDIDTYYGDTKINSFNDGVLVLAGTTFSAIAGNVIIDSATVSIGNTFSNTKIGHNVAFGPTGASFSFKEYDSNTGRSSGFDFVLGTASSKLTQSAYNAASMQTIEHGLELGSTGSSLSFDNASLSLGTASSSFKQQGWDGNYNNYIDTGLTIGASSSSFLFKKLGQGGANDPVADAELTLGSSSLLKSDHLTITSDEYFISASGASFSFKENSYGSEFVLGTASSKLTYSIYNMVGMKEIGLTIATSSTSLSGVHSSEGFEQDTRLELGTASSLSFDGWVNGGQSVVSSDVTLGASSSSLKFSLDTSGNKEEAELTLGTSSLLKSDDLTITSGGLTITSDKYFISATGASYSFGDVTGKSDFSLSKGSLSFSSYSNYGNDFTEFTIATQSGIRLTTSGVYDSLPLSSYPNGLVVGSQSANLTISTGYDGNNGEWNVVGLQVGTVSTLSGGTASIVLGGTGGTAGGPISITGLASYTEDYSAQFGTHSLVTKSYVDSLDAAQITGVEALNGLTGGGTAGNVVLGIGGTVSTDVILNFTQSGSGYNAVWIMENPEYVGIDNAGHISATVTNSSYSNYNSGFAVSYGDVSMSVGNGTFSGGINISPVQTSVFSDNVANISASNYVSVDTQGILNIQGGTSSLSLGSLDLSSDSLTVNDDSLTGTFSNSVVISGPSSSSINMSTGGDVTLMAAPTGNATVASALGNVTVSSAAGNVLVSSASGNVDVITVVGDATLGSGTNTLVLGTSSNTFTDGVNTKGIEYAADYSANFTDRSLVDKAYADTKVSGVTAGAGLSGGGVDGDITLNADITIDGGLTFSSTGNAGTIEVVVDNSTIQVVNGELAVVAGTSQPVYQSATCSVANGDTGIALTSTPNDYSRIEVYVNGQLQNLTENTTGDCYFGAAGTVLTSLTSGDSLHWNSANAGFELSATDVIKVHYQA